jgi:pyruvate dehydrogenase E1 component alpha subunit
VVTGDVPALRLPDLEPVRLLGPDGTLRESAEYPLDLADGDLADLYRLLVVTRRVDQEAVNLQRQGQLGAYPPGLGQEAAQVGPVYALGKDDWLFPAYREMGAAIVRGLPPSAILHLFRGTWHGAHDPYQHRVALLCLPIGTQTLHAVGFALGTRLDGKPIVTLVYLGDGATSEGDPQEAFNFAAVFGVPLVFLVQNNQYALSVPLARQTRAPSIAHKAIGYGMPGVRVDGNDVLACYAVTRQAVERARAGGGPTLIEAVTYRLAPHSTADDPTRYRDESELRDWEARDPLTRMEALLRRRGLLDEALLARVEQDARDHLDRLRAEIVDAPAPDPLELFDHVYVEPPPIYRRQRTQLAAEIEAAREAEG